MHKNVFLHEELVHLVDRYCTDLSFANCMQLLMLFVVFEQLCLYSLYFVVIVFPWSGTSVMLLLHNNNNVHLSCAHQRPEHSHDTY